jgi:hypothetical protein
MKPSAMRRKIAVDAARKFVYNQIQEMPQGFDERQKRIFDKYVISIGFMYDTQDSINNDLWIAYTGSLQEDGLQEDGLQEEYLKIRDV